ncbi:MAG: hypothetical protein ACOCV8_05310 [Spirochaetota bacterium]
MDNVKDIIEDYIIELDLPYKVPEENTWLIDDFEQNIENIIVNINDEIVTLRITICNLPSDNKEKLFKTLLELNTNLVYGGYGIVEDKIVLSHSVLLESLTYDKFSYVYNAFTLSLLNDLKKIKNELL